MIEWNFADSSAQTPEFLANRSQALVRRYETLLVTLDLFESTMVCFYKLSMRIDIFELCFR